MKQQTVVEEVPRLDKTLVANLDIIKGELQKDFDWVMGIIGYEGMGKSSLGVPMCRYVDPTFDVSRVVFTAEEFQMALNKAEKYQAILVDEGSEVFLSLQTMSRGTVEAMKTLTQIRFKNLFIVVVISDWALLTRYSKSHRIRTLCRVTKRGVFEFYSKKRIRMIRTDPITRAVVFPSPNFIGTFAKTDGKLWQQYLKKKEAFANAGRRQKVWDERLKIELKMKKSFSMSDMTSMTGLSKDTVRNYWRNYDLFPRREKFHDIFNQNRVSEKGYRIFMKRLEQARKKVGGLSRWEKPKIKSRRKKIYQPRRTMKKRAGFYNKKHKKRRK